MNDELLKKLPFSLIAEQSLLGAILIDPDCFNDIADKIYPSDFYLTEHAQIYTAMHELFLANKEIDVVTLIDTLVTRGIYSKSGGEDYITETVIPDLPAWLNIALKSQLTGHKAGDGVPLCF